jgi:hypothetical protein
VEHGLSGAAHALRGNGNAVDETLLQYLSPLGWEHINLTGDYLWRSSAKIGAGKFRPLTSATGLRCFIFCFLRRPLYAGFSFRGYCLQLNIHLINGMIYILTHTCGCHPRPGGTPVSCTAFERGVDEEAASKEKLTDR